MCRILKECECISTMPNSIPKKNVSQKINAKVPHHILLMAPIMCGIKRGMCCTLYNTFRASIAHMNIIHKKIEHLLCVSCIFFAHIYLWYHRTIVNKHGARLFKNFYCHNIFWIGIHSLTNPLKYLLHLNCRGGGGGMSGSGD